MAAPKVESTNNSNNVDSKPKATKQEELRLDIGDFELGDKLGDGAFSEVFKGSLKKRMSATHRLRQYGEYFACKIIDRRSITINRQASSSILSFIHLSI